jgi:hypothetical protein
MSRTTIGRELGLAAVLLACAACDKAGVTATSEVTTAESELQDLAGLIQLAAHEKKPAPRTVAELSQISAATPPGAIAVEEGRIVFLFGRGYDARSAAILAYEKAAPSQGGFVLLQDATVKRLTAAEFQSAPKAR